MSLQEIIDQLNLTLLTEPKNLSEVHPTGGYTSDLLSCVMAGAKKGCLWVTLQAHMNIVAVAALLDISAIIVTEDAQPDAAVIGKANDQGVVLLATPASSFQIVGKLWELGIRAN